MNKSRHTKCITIFQALITPKGNRRAFFLFKYISKRLSSSHNTRPLILYFSIHFSTPSPKRSIVLKCPDTASIHITELVLERILSYFIVRIHINNFCCFLQSISKCIRITSTIHIWIYIYSENCRTPISIPISSSSIPPIKTPISSWFLGSTNIHFFHSWWWIFRFHATVW